MNTRAYTHCCRSLFRGNRRVTVKVSNLKAGAICHFIPPGKGPRNLELSFPTSLLVSTRLDHDDYDDTITRLENKLSRSQKLNSDRYQVKRDERAEQFRQQTQMSYRIFETMGGNTSARMSIKDRLDICAVPEGVIDYHLIKSAGCAVGQDLLHISARDPRHCEVGGLRGNHHLTDQTRRALPHMTPGDCYNPDKKVWLTPKGSFGAFDFFHRHHKGYYPPESNPIDPRGEYFAYFVYASNPLYDHASQLRTGSNFAVNPYHALLCYVSFPAGHKGTFLEANMVVAFRDRVWTRIVKFGDTFVNIPLSDNGTWCDEVCVRACVFVYFLTNR